MFCCPPHNCHPFPKPGRNDLTLLCTLFTQLIDKRRRPVCHVAQVEVAVDLNDWHATLPSKSHHCCTAKHQTMEEGQKTARLKLVEGWARVRKFVSEKERTRDNKWTLDTSALCINQTKEHQRGGAMDILLRLPICEKVSERCATKYFLLKI